MGNTVSCSGGGGVTSISSIRFWTDGSLRLPRGCQAKLIGEGAANVVFELVFDKPSSPEALACQGYLLRVPKAGKKTHSYTEAQSFWEKEMLPLFGHDQLVEQTLVDLTSSNIIHHLNEVLEAQEGRRRPDFVGSRVADVSMGMLVEDMRKRTSSDFALEFKPKWLAQSPTAPPSSRRCRTCAREALRLSQLPANDTHEPRIPFCPLDLIACRSSSRPPPPVPTAKTSGHPPCSTCSTSDSVLNEHATSALQGNHNLDQKAEQRERTVLVLCAALAPEMEPGSPQHQALAHWLRTNDLMPMLARVQEVSDPFGFPLAPPLSTLPNSPTSPDSSTSQQSAYSPHSPHSPLRINGKIDDFNDEARIRGLELAMALRDCSCYLRISCAPRRRSVSHASTRTKRSISLLVKAGLVGRRNSVPPLCSADTAATKTRSWRRYSMPGGEEQHSRKEWPKGREKGKATEAETVDHHGAGTDSKNKAAEWHVEAKLGDLDRKHIGKKLYEWRLLEDRLRDEGFYECKELRQPPPLHTLKERGPVGRVFPHVTTPIVGCLLERTVR